MSSKPVSASEIQWQIVSNPTINISKAKEVMKNSGHTDHSDCDCYLDLLPLIIDKAGKSNDLG